MGKGDKRSTKGKIWRGSHGKTRTKKVNKPQPKLESIPKPAAS
ncbi:MAG: 30S ribosomal protein THX [Saprospirales bacterium]|nr:30S ribosomal protein THX [Saprospirales bacterium]MBK8490757.1 30S ribosomal protein THX [Saprospirales bacterium]